MVDEQLQALTILAGTPQLGTRRILRLIEAFGSPLEALQASPCHLLELPGFGAKSVASWGWWKSCNSWQENLEEAERQGAEIIAITSEGYPELLKKIEDPPLLLYVKGGSLKDLGRFVAVVGSRKATDSGLEKAKQIGKELKEAGCTVVSGLAKGIDKAAHESVLEVKGETVAILPSGISCIYPSEHQELAKRIAVDGALVSEYPMRAAPQKSYFLRRNRIITGLSGLGVILVEAREKSGSMQAAEMAVKQKRRLFAVSWEGRCSVGNGNASLIESGKAEAIHSGKDSLRSLFLEDKRAKPSVVKMPVLLMRLLQRAERKSSGKVFNSLVYKELS